MRLADEETLGWGAVIAHVSHQRAVLALREQQVIRLRTDRKRRERVDVDRRLRALEAPRRVVQLGAVGFVLKFVFEQTSPAWTALIALASPISGLQYYMGWKRPGQEEVIEGFEYVAE